METKKHDHANLEKKRSRYFKIGLMMSLAATLVAFEWTTYEDSDFTNRLGDDLAIFEAEEIPIYQPRPPEIPQPERVVNNDLPPVIGEPDPIIPVDPIKPDPNITDSFVVFTEDSSLWTPEPPEPEYEEFRIVEDMPAWKTTDVMSRDELRDYTDARIFEFLGKNVRYPQICRDAGITGVVYVEYLVDQTGAVSDVQVIRGVHPAMDKEAKRVISMMPDFTPGKQRGKAVPVRFTIPIRFSLKN